MRTNKSDLLIYFSERCFDQNIYNLLEKMDLLTDVMRFISLKALRYKDTFEILIYIL